MTTYRQTINTALSRTAHLNIDLRRLNEEIGELEKDKSAILEMLAVSRKAAKAVQDALCSRLSSIVTKAIQSVLEKDLEFTIDFVERRGVSEADLYIKDAAGHEYDILDARGGGLADVCSLSLQLAFILLSDVDRYLIVDELARHLSVDKQERFAEILKHLCKEFGFTVIAVTHAKAFMEVADRVFHVTIDDKERSSVRETI